MASYAPINLLVEIKMSGSGSGKIGCFLGLFEYLYSFEGLTTPNQAGEENCGSLSQARLYLALQ